MQTTQEFVLARMRERAAILDLMMIMTGEDGKTTEHREQQVTMMLEQQDKEIQLIQPFKES